MSFFSRAVSTTPAVGDHIKITDSQILRDAGINNDPDNWNKYIAGCTIVDIYENSGVIKYLVWFDWSTGGGFYSSELGVFTNVSPEKQNNISNYTISKSNYPTIHQYCDTTNKPIYVLDYGRDSRCTYIKLFPTDVDVSDQGGVNTKVKFNTPYGWDKPYDNCIKTDPTKKLYCNQSMKDYMIAGKSRRKKSKKTKKTKKTRKSKKTKKTKSKKTI